MNEPDITQAELIRGKLNSETARIPWRELQRYFAGGYTLLVDQQLDLIEVGYQLQQDNSALVADWLQQELLQQVSNQQARQWHNDDAELWACVVKPWVLIQPAD
ncbi:MAG: DUF2288 domain-containing protein [Gammaproteobacteria bacterium]|nr:DUF2288 domain-containing protein [Gammaproteobacteria bacterium]